MKEITFENTELLYEITSYETGDFGETSSYETKFYSPDFEVVKRKKYYLFGDIVEIKVHELLFTVNFSIESHYKTKEDVYKVLKRNVDLLNRRKEIKNGKLF